MQEGSPSGECVFDHVSGLLLKILSEKPPDAVSNFESLSRTVKKRSHSENAAADPTNESAIRAQITAAKFVLNTLNLNEGGPSDAPSVQDIVEDGSMLNWAGLNLGQHDFVQMACFMKKLVNQQNEENSLDIEKIRFWGKILGNKGIDYYIYECLCGRDVEVPEGVRMEGKFGPNRLTYFTVCSDNMNVARKLPDVTETQLIIARQIKKYFTGDLVASVSGYPPFPGNEANYLRAQIALISSDTLVSPSGFFEVVLSDDGIKEVHSRLGAEEEAPPEFPGFESLGNLGMWSHFEMPISSMGRMQEIPVGEDGETSDPFYGNPEELREVTQTLDNDVEEELANWKVKQYPSSGGPGSVSVVSSLKWPGAVAVYQCGTPRFVNCYVGYGVASVGVSYTPPSLPEIQREFGYNFAEQIDATEQPISDLAEDDAE